MEREQLPFTDGNDRWKAYTGMAAAFVAVAPDANAQVIYTDVNPDEVIVDGEFAIDFDNDGTDDVTLVHISTASSGFQIDFAGAVGEVIGTVASSSYMYPSVLAAGAPIAPGDPNWQVGYSYGTLGVRYSYSSSQSQFGPWPGQTGYLGVRFTAGSGSVHYAWVQLSVGSECENIIVQAYAFQATPDLGINAGETGSTSVEEARSGGLDLTLFPNPAHEMLALRIAVERSGAYQVNIINGMGQVMAAHQYTVGAGDHRFDLDISDLAAGTYVMEVRGADKVLHRTFTKSN